MKHEGTATTAGDCPAGGAVCVNEIDVSELDTSGLDERIVEIGRAQARLQAMMATALAERSARSSTSDTSIVLRSELRWSARQAYAETKLAEELSDGLANTVKAMAAGEIHAGHARVIVNAQGDPDNHNETDLLEMALSEPPDRLGRMVRKWLRHDPDIFKRVQRQRENRTASLIQQPDGAWEMFARFDMHCGKNVSLALAAMMRHLRKCKSTTGYNVTGAKHRADALARLILGADPCHVERAALVVVAQFDPETKTIGDFRYDDHSPVPTDRLGTILAKAKVVPAIFDTVGRPLWLGRSQRKGSAAQRLALTARDGGCVSCAAPGEMCQAHHIRWWRNGGATDVDNLALLCESCHNQVHKNGASIGPDPLRPASFTLTHLPPRKRKPPAPPEVALAA